MDRMMNTLSGAGVLQAGNNAESHDSNPSGMTGRRRPYEKMMIEAIEIEPETIILQGSDTARTVSVKNEVKVTEFSEDTAFPTDGFDVSFE